MLTSFMAWFLAKFMIQAPDVGSVKGAFSNPWIWHFGAVKNLKLRSRAKNNNGIAKRSTEMNFWQKVEQDWSLKCQNWSIIGVLTSNLITACSLRDSQASHVQLRKLYMRTAVVINDVKT